MEINRVFTFAGDESGDASFRFGKGATPYFVLAMIATDDPDQLRSVMRNLRIEHRLPETYEFKFHKLTGKKIRTNVFETLAHSNFKAWAIFVNKTHLPDQFQFISSIDFYLYFVTELIRLIPIREQSGALLILDEFGTKENIATVIRRMMKTRKINSQFKRMIARKSDKESLIQIADLLAGALSHRDSSYGSEAMDIIGKKIIKVVEYP